MKCRRINPENGMVVWFGVKDVNAKEAAVCSEATTASDDLIVGDWLDVTFQNDNDKHDNYASGSEGVINSLRQRLSVLKNELWYDYENGMPLTDKVKSKAVIDSYVAKTVLSHPDVIDIEGFESEQNGHEYSCYMEIATIYGQIAFGM